MLFRSMLENPDIRFTQPVHNIYVLVLSEAGILSLIFFGLFLYEKLKASRGNFLLYVSIIQILFLGTFDHYFFTAQQTQLLFWLVLGLI